MAERVISKPIFAKELFFEAFGDSEEYLCRFEKIAFSPDRCHYIFDGERVVSALYWFDCEYEGNPIAYVYGVATEKSHRGRGLCHRLFEETHSILRERGYVGAILVPADEGLCRLYESIGYSAATRISETLCPASESAEPIEEISKSEYAALRRKYLPERSVIQEGACLELLGSYARFYKGEDLVLVCQREGKSLRLTELLGNKDKAPGIVKALGFETAVCRTPGGDKPFAMYYPLTDEGKNLPAYFGLALD